MAGIIIAMDGMLHSEALKFAESIPGTSESGIILKANDLLDDPGPQIIHEFGNMGFLVFADAKFHDIPKTVSNRAKKLDSGHAHFITVHASGGVDMMRAAVESTEHSNILAVTVLTSHSEEECNLVFGVPVKAKVLQFARDALHAGVHGIVCSPKELKFLSEFKELRGLEKITPGIRPKWHLDPDDDQARVTTPADAVRMGADFLVIGRPITKASDPAEAIEKTQAEINAALAEKK